MKKKKAVRRERQPDPRLDPETRLVPQFDSTGIKKYEAPDAARMGVRVLDNFPEEHIQ